MGSTYIFQIRNSVDTFLSRARLSRPDKGAARQRQGRSVLPLASIWPENDLHRVSLRHFRSVGQLPVRPSEETGFVCHTSALRAHILKVGRRPTDVSHAASTSEAGPRTLQDHVTKVAFRRSCQHGGGAKQNARTCRD